jgi:hypothetical protein
MIFKISSGRGHMSNDNVRSLREMRGSRLKSWWPNGKKALCSLLSFLSLPNSPFLSGHPLTKPFCTFAQSFSCLSFLYPTLLSLLHLHPFSSPFLIQLRGITPGKFLNEWTNTKASLCAYLTKNPGLVRFYWLINVCHL